MAKRIKVSHNIDGVKTKLGPKNADRGRYAMGNQMIADMNQFVPMKDGILRSAVNLSADNREVIYTSKHSKPQFYGRGSNGAIYNKYSTPGTGKRWDLKAKSIYLSSWERAYLRGAGIT